MEPIVHIINFEKGEYKYGKDQKRDNNKSIFPIHRYLIKKLIKSYNTINFLNEK